MGIVDRAVEDAVGQGVIVDLLVPLADGELRGEDQRARLVAIFADFPEVAALGFVQRCHGPVIHFKAELSTWLKKRNFLFCVDSLRGNRLDT